MRPSKDTYYLKLARVVAERSTCLRSRYGSVIVNHDRVVSSGYNGSPRGVSNCSDIGSCRRDDSGASRYDLCRSVHSEPNAIIHCDYKDLVGSSLYIARDPSSNPSVREVAPCNACKRLIINAQISRVVCLQDDDTVLEWDPQNWLEDL